MNAGTRLGLYAAGLVVTFGAAYALSGAVVPKDIVTSWKEGSTMRSHEGHGGPTHADGSAAAGLSLADGGFMLSPVSAPRRVGESGTLAFRIEKLDGTVVRAFETAHEKELHLIVVRADGAEFRHVHPTMGEDGTWTIEWTWAAAGSYRVFADVKPAEGDGAGVTLTRMIHVEGHTTPVVPDVTRRVETGSLTVDLEGQLVAGEPSALTAFVSRDGRPVTTLEPYLGAYGHLVALRQGDLAYLHVHADGAAPRAGETSGPKISFVAEAPTAGRYLLYLDIRVDGRVHTAPFVLDAARPGDAHASHDVDHE